MPWIWIIIGGVGLYLLVKKNQDASWFYEGQIINVPENTTMYSDAALTQDAGQWPGGTATIKVVDTAHNSIGIVGPSGQGLGGGAPAYVPSAMAQVSGRTSI